MVAECLILGSSAVALKDAVSIEYLKSKMTDLSEQEKQDILNNNERRFLHFTSQKSAKEIMKSGFFIPTKGVLDNHFAKKIDENGKKKNSEMVYMFDSNNLNIEDYIKNLPKKNSPYNGVYEYYAVSMAPNEYNINSFKRRIEDGAITYDGRLDITGTDTKLAKFVIDLDKDNNYTFKEVALNEEYIPSEELLQKLSHDRKSTGISYAVRNYVLEVKKARDAMKVYRANSAEYKEQIKKKREFAKANKQFIAEEKDKNYIYEKDGKTIVVKNIGYEQVDGRKLQKVAIIGNGFEHGDKGLEDVQKLCYMDEFNIENIESEVASKYFFSNYENMLQNEKTQEYIGLPLQDLESGTVINEYDEKFKNHFLRKQVAKSYSEQNIQDKNIGIFSKMKSFFEKITSRFRNDETKLLPEAKSNVEYEDKEQLAKLGYSSVEEMNRYDASITILDELQSQTYSSYEQINENRDIREAQISQNDVERDSQVVENPDDFVV